jgi:hypothetical protein
MNRRAALLCISLASVACGSETDEDIGRGSNQLSVYSWRWRPNKVDLCHATRGKQLYVPNRVPEVAVRAHLAHGDHLVSEDFAGACGKSCVACGPTEACHQGECCRPITCADHGYDCGTISDGCGGIIDCGSCAPGAVCDAGTCYACEPTPSILDGHYEGTATIYIFRAIGGDEPICATTATTTSTWVELDVRVTPSIEVEMEFPGYVPDPEQILIDFTGQAWELSGTSMTLDWLCDGPWGSYSSYLEWHRATLQMYPGPGSVALNVRCSAGHMDDCSHPDNWITTYSMILSRVCLPNDTICVGDTVVTCDENGTITESVACGAPCGSL